MKNLKLNKIILLVSFLTIFISPVFLFAQKEEDEIPAEVTSLEQLILKVQEEALYDSEENRQRIAKFSAEKDTQQQILNKTLADLKVQEDRAIVLEKEFDENDVKLSELEDLKAERLGAFGELFGVVRGTASVMGAQLKESIISGELTGRHETLSNLAKSKKLPSNDELELLWFHLLEEMKAQGEVKHFTGTIVDTDGSFSEEEVVRVGPWTAYDRRGNFLGYLPDDERYRVLGRQPQARFVDLADKVVDGDAGDIVKGAIDPSRGAILGLLIQTPGLSERISQGGVVGYIIIGLLIIGLLLSAERIFRLTSVSRSVSAQAKDVDNPKDSNPLGRVLTAYHSNKSADVETLELKLDDAILKELPALERGINFIKLLSSVAPLLGLLGTVTGMIVTFQAITLFGNVVERLAQIEANKK